MTAPLSICPFCKYFRAEVKDKLSCDAYPDGIPTEIIMMEVDHRKPYKGDRGIQFEEGTREEART